MFLNVVGCLYVGFRHADFQLATQVIFAMRTV